MLLCVLFNTSAFNKPDYTGLKNENHFKIINSNSLKNKIKNERFLFYFTHFFKRI